ncbi:DUF4188 domain-containing protein [Pseudonocardia sp. CA-107938]|uniref:DUF4188 domain-containing protein n=1 Tax=Pseudonocardia sp. CA-107938 TaxID=3240021 RepID=UPI003D8B3279
MRTRAGRWTHDSAAVPEGMVVFLIGMTVTKWWRPDRWWPTFVAMLPMLVEQHRRPELGVLGTRTLVGRTGPVIVQYWRDAESLYRYASATDAHHRSAWARFNKAARAAPDAVGVWHETFPVAAAESVYVDMPVVGLAAAVGSVPVSGSMRQARDRLAAGKR